MPDRLKRYLFIIAGTLSVILGVIGIFLPVLPTTPFLLLAAACYIRGSQKMYNLLLNNRYLGAYIRSYLEGKGMPLKVKCFTIALLWITIGLTTFLVIENLAIRIVLLIIACGVTAHILWIKTYRKQG